MKSLSNVTLALFIAAVFLFQFSIPVFASEQKIALFPFSINSEKNMSFLEKGIFEMLSAKFSAEKYSVIRIDEENISNQTDYLRISKEKNTDFAVSGSVMVFGNTINTSAFLYDVKSGDKLVVFNKSDNNKDNLFAHIDLFADEAIKKISLSKPIEKSEQTSVDEKIVTAQQKEVTNPPPEQSVEKAFLSTPVFKTKSVDGSVVSLTTGDVNGDGVREIIFLNESDIVVARYSGGQYSEQSKITGKHYLKNISVCVFDTNKNGIDEIFITSIHRNSKFVQSYVFEWNGSEYIETIKKSKWFFETTILADSGEKTLVGQKQHFAEGIFSKGVYKLMYDKTENDFVSGDRINLPDNTNIYSLTSGEVMADGVRNVVSLSNNGYITVFNKEQKNLWKSSDTYGGSLKYLEPRKNDTQRRLYFAPRIIAEDIDKDSLTEIVTIKNHNSSPSALINLKSYSKGYISCLVWDKLNFEPKWNTQTVSGYISDFNISDIDNDGKNDLIYSVVENVGKFWRAKKTYFVIQPVQ